ncbi:hypothetical protein KY313_02015 [Candidatus Woesearchaeota archaeon]|jgi:hypothetical protein|nr:hypothetical protein [Candidatus Woesearchaeota archaeon]
MGHHPPINTQPIQGAAVVDVGGGVSPIGWFLIVFSIAVIVYLVYTFIKKKS